MKTKIIRFKKFCEQTCFTLFGMGVVMLFCLPEYINLVPEFLVPVAERADITSGSVMFTLIPGMVFGLMAFGCDVFTHIKESAEMREGKETEDGKTI